MPYSVTTEKTWARILDDIETSLDKWRGVTAWKVDAILAPRSSTKQNQTTEERTVTLHWSRKKRDYQITMDRQRRAVDNLLVCWLIIEALRMNEARGLTTQIAAVYRQEFPALLAPGQAAARGPAGGNPYAVLFVQGNAPLEVAEAAYRALSKRYHPDTTGSDAAQAALNVAIEAIRKEKAK